MLSVIAFIVGFFAPRILSVYLYFFSGWFVGVFETRGWPLLGFVFVPRTMLWYSVVMNWNGGHWSAWQYIGLVVAIALDLGWGKTSYDRRKPYGCF